MDIEERGKLYTFDWEGIRFSALVDDFMVYYDEEPDGRQSATIDDLQFVVRMHINNFAVPLSDTWEDYWPKELWELVSAAEAQIENDLIEMANDGDFREEPDYS